MWNRTFSQDFSTFHARYHACNELRQVLQRTGCKRLIVGHTPQVCLLREAVPTRQACAQHVPGEARSAGRARRACVLYSTRSPAMDVSCVQPLNGRRCSASDRAPADGRRPLLQCRSSRGSIPSARGWCGAWTSACHRVSLTPSRRCAPAKHLLSVRGRSGSSYLCGAPRGGLTEGMLLSSAPGSQSQDYAQCTAIACAMRGVRKCAVC